MSKPKKRSPIHLEGTATAKVPVTFEVQITDPKYEVELLKEDIHFKRVWFEPPADDDGWMKLVYSADGLTGDPWTIGKLKLDLGSDAETPNYGHLSNLIIEQPKKV